MEIEYSVTKENYIEEFLYEYSKNENQIKKDQKSYLSLIFYLILCSFLGIFLKNNYVIFVPIIISFYYIINYFFFRKNRIKQNVIKNTQDRITAIDIKYDCNFEKSKIIFNDDAIESKIRIKSVNEVLFLPKTTIIKLYRKRRFLCAPNESDREKLIQYFNSLNVPIIIENDWKW